MTAFRYHDVTNTDIIVPVGACLVQAQPFKTCLYIFQKRAFMKFHPNPFPGVHGESLISSEVCCQCQFTRARQSRESDLACALYYSTGSEYRMHDTWAYCTWRPMPRTARRNRTVHRDTVPVLPHRYQRQTFRPDSRRIRKARPKPDAHLPPSGADCDSLAPSDA
jgi:hypothetical protein